MSGPPHVKREPGSPAAPTPAPSGAPGALFRFGEFELDTQAGALRRAGEAVAVGPQVLALLELLVQHQGEVVSHELVYERVWPGVSVTDISLRQAVWELRQILSDSAAAPAFVQTLRGRGYRFIAPVTRAAPALLREGPKAEAGADFVGRRAELAQLLEALDGAAADSGRAALLRGPPGIGKSRLARELSHRAETRGVTCLETTADREVGAPPFWAFVQLLNGLSTALSPAERARVFQDVPLIGGVLQQGIAALRSAHAPLTAGPDVQRLYLFEELTRVLTAVARDRPLLLLFEDVQWLDEASIAFLHYFVGVLSRTRALVVLTCRSFARRDNRPLAQALDALGRGPLNAVIELSPFCKDEVAQLLARHAHEASPDMLGQVHALTLGNPLFALEVARLLGRRDGAATTLAAHGELRAVIRKRLASAPNDCLEVAQAASIWGDSCGIAELAALLDEPHEATFERVDDCVRRGILTERPGLRFGFAHPLVCEVAYESLSSLDRSRLHQKAGVWLEQRPDSRSARLELLAHHFLCAAATGFAQKAVAYAIQCGERAYLATAYATAVQHYEHAASASALLDDFPPSQKLALEVARAEALRAAGADPASTDALFLSLFERAKELAEPALLARAARGYNTQRTAGRALNSYGSQQDARGVALLEEALAALPPDDDAERALVTCALSVALMHGPERARREAFARESLACARRVGKPALVAHALTFIQWTCAAPDAYETQLGAARQLAELAQAHQMREVELGASLTLIVVSLYAADRHAAERASARALVLGELIGSARTRWVSRLLSLIEAFWRGDLDEAERLTQSIFEARPIDVQYESVYMTRMSALCILRAGRAHLPQLIAQLQSVLALVPNVSTACTLASAYAAANEDALAGAQFDALAADDFRRIPEGPAWFGDMIALADCAVRLGDPVRARRVYDRLSAYRARMAFFYYDAMPSGPIARALCELATVLGDLDEAERLLATSRALNQRLGATLFLQYDDLAEALLRSTARAPGWEARVEALLDGVIAFAEPRGARWLVDSARAMARQTLASSISRLLLGQ